MRTALTFVFILLLTLGSSAETEKEFLTQCQSSRVIFLGESHSSEQDHQGQLRALKALASLEEKPLIIVCEMFNELSPDQLHRFFQEGDTEWAQSFWEEQWGHPRALYSPIFQWSLSEGHTITHLRPDPKRAKELKEEGVSACLELLGEFFLGPSEYHTHLQGIAAKHMPEGVEVPKRMMDSFFLVQCFWDEYMAWRTMKVAEEYPDNKIVVLVGHGHLRKDFGIPLRLRRRAPELTLLTVGFTENPNWRPDFIWLPESSGAH